MELHKQIVELLKSLPNLHGEAERRAFIYSAVLSKDLENEIEFGGATSRFCQLLVRTLAHYGTIEQKRHALVAALEAAKQQVGQEKREICDALIQQVQAAQPQEFESAGMIPFMVEALPADFVPRPAEHAQVVQCLVQQPGTAVAMTAALRGAGGFGKTTLARAICWDAQVRAAFPDGIVWITLGETPGDLTGKVCDVIEALTAERPGFQDLGLATARLTEVFGDRHLLLLIDDVWDLAHLRPLLQGGPHCARLITTRNSDTLPPDAHKINVDAMQTNEAVTLLTANLSPIPAELQPAVHTLATMRLGEWPLLLKLVNGVLREQVEFGATLKDALDYVNAGLAEEGLTAFDTQNTADRNRAVTQTLALSLKHLTAEESHNYQQLAIFPEDTPIPLPTLTKLWHGISNFKVKNLCQRLWKLSLLLDYNAAQETIRLHDVMRAYLLQQYRPEELQAQHNAFLAAYKLEKWADLPPVEPYLWRYLPYHLVAAGRPAEIRALLLNFEWLARKLRATDINALLADYDLSLATSEGTEDDHTLRLVQGALRLSAHVLAVDANQLASQLHGRLLAQPSPAIQTLLRFTKGSGRWLRPLTCTLTPSGGALLRTLTGHLYQVTAVAVTPDGTRVVSGSYNGSLSVWDLRTGVCQQTLIIGHTSYLNAVAVMPDGTRAVSGADDYNLKVWDLKTGNLLTTFTAEAELECCVVTPDGRTIVAGDKLGHVHFLRVEKGELQE